MALMNCPECGKEMSNLASSCPYCGYQMKIKCKGFWSAGRLVIGILSIAISLIMALISASLWIMYSVAKLSLDSYIYGIVFSVLIASAGIIGIYTRNSVLRTGPIIAAILYLLAFMGTPMIDSSGSLLEKFENISACFAVVFVICAFNARKIKTV